MNRNMRLSNASVICPDCGVPYRDGARHHSGYKDGQSRCARQHKRKSEKASKKGKPVPYSRGG